ncbi:MAG: mechanosensitive ion channel protein MscS [Chloroflexi bacterium]|nr:mechanosensitive ion channel protein MscS [Chloroflexota bacterium]
MESFSGIIIDIIVFIKIFFSDLGLQAITHTFLFHIILVAFVTLIFSLIINKIIIVFIRKWLSKLKFDIGKHLINNRVFVPIGWAVPILIFEAGLGDYSPKGGILYRFSEALIILVCVISITRLLTALTEIFKGNKFFAKTPIQSYVQLLKLIVYVFGLIIIVCVITNTSPITIVSGLGALTAILLLVFKDTILGLVASIQVFGSDTIREGDWVTIPSLDIDGDCVEVGLHTVTVRSWDKALITFPSAKLLEHPFKNWRGMEDSGGRRIKRSLNIDQDSIMFLNEELRKKLDKLNLLKNHFIFKDKEIEKYNTSTVSDEVNYRKLTNIGVFRAYILSYLKNNDRINQKLTMMVRQLEPNNHGVPLEVYAFTNSTDWIEYEEDQSDIFDHLLAIISLFNLRIVQNPSGHDIKYLSKNLD